MCKKIKLLISIIIISLLNYSCVVQKKIRYLQPREGLTNIDFPVNQSASEHKIEKGDILSIQVNSTVATDMDVIDKKFKNDKGTAGDDLFGYAVDNQGNVTLPILGRIQLEGLTLSQASDTLQAKFEEYIKYITVSVKMKGLRFSILGEVGLPGEKFTAYNRTNLYQAIALSGDFTLHSNRKNVKLIRKENNINKVYTFDFTQRDILLSDKFYIQPNDIIIVDTRNSKIIQENIRNASIYISLITLALVLYSRFSTIK